MIRNLLSRFVTITFVVLVGLATAACPDKNSCGGLCEGVASPSPATPAAISVDIKFNGADGEIKVPYGTGGTVTWAASSNTASCTVGPNGWPGTSGSQSSGNLTVKTTYTATCTAGGQTATDSVTVTVTYRPATMQIVICPGGQGSLCSGGTVLVGGTTVNMAVGSYKVWTVISHFSQVGCTLDGSIGASAWSSGSPGQIIQAQEDKWPNPATVAIALNITTGTGQVVANFQETCPGQVTPLHQAATINAPR